MNLHDYLIDQAEKPWSEWLSGWADVLPPVFTLWLVNRFGNVFVVMADDSVHLLDLEVGTLDRIADHREHCATLLKECDNASQWLMTPLVDACVAAGITLGPHQCYGFKLPPLLGGRYEIDNVYPAELTERYGFMADLFRQTKDLPDGTEAELEFA